jgi:GNAT superfamily N-acetyltransferase
MRPAPELLPGRRLLMQGHARSESFRALGARQQPGGPLIGFGYGFHGTAGQWWHDTVLAALSASAGSHVAAWWLADCVEIAELHVHPLHQRRGIGRQLLCQLAAGRAERTAMLSTPDVDSTARRLYRGLGFTDLLSGYEFPGSGPPFAIMGAPLPLRAAVPAAVRSARPSSW